MNMRPDISGIARERHDGIDVLRRRGQGATIPLVLLHGVGSNASSFGPLMQALPASFDAIAWDAPGYGGSEALQTPTPTPQDYANAVGQLLGALTLDRVVLVGHSLGAMFATRFAAQNAARVALLVLLSPALGYRVAPGAALPTQVQARLDELTALGPRAFAAKRAARLVGDPQRTPAVAEAVERAMAAVNPPGYAQAVHALGAGDLLADAPEITMPTLVATGLADVVTPPANAQAVHAALRIASSLEEIAGAGHALPQERPDIVAGLIAKWVDRHVAA